MIVGIESISRSKRSAVLAFIADNFDLDDSITIEEEDGDILQINETRYFIIRAEEEYDIMDKINEERFEEAFSNLSNEQKKYINKDAWLENKGLYDFMVYLKDVLDELPSDPQYYEGFSFYEL